MTSPLLSRKDLNFLLYEWLDAEGLNQRARFADHSRETFDAALDTYEAIATELFLPHNKKNDQIEPRFDGTQVSVNPEVAASLRAFSDAGLMAAAHDFALGGMQLPTLVERAGLAYVLAANVSSAAYAFLTIANANLLFAHGGPALLERFAKPLLSGRFLGTMCLSEPHAGSSLADISTKAEREPDGTFRIRGNKMWISGGDHDISVNIVHLVLAKIPDEQGRLPDGIGGISLFVVPRQLVADDGQVNERNDVVVAGLNHKMGFRGTSNCLLNFGEGRYLPGGRSGAVAYLVGEAGQGLRYMFHMMDEARIGVGLIASSLGYVGYLHSLDYARSRLQGRPIDNKNPGNPQTAIIGHTDVKRMLLAQKSYAEGGLALTLYCARLVDDSNTAEDAMVRERARRLLGLLTPIAKSWPSQWCLEANSLAIQVHGGYGYTRDYTVEQFYRDNRLNLIHEGTHGIQALDLLGRKIRLDDGAALRLLSSSIGAVVREARSAAALASLGDALDRAWCAMESVIASLGNVENETLRLANATAFLEAFGHVVVAWIWLQQALAAQARLQRTEDPESINFYRGKLQACHYFIGWELPKITAWLAVLSPVDRTCVDMQDRWF